MYLAPTLQLTMTNPVSTTGGNFLIKGTSTVNGNVTNDGLVKTTGANVTWNGTVTNNSAYISDLTPPRPSSRQPECEQPMATWWGTSPLSMSGAASRTSSSSKKISRSLTQMIPIRTNNWDTHNAAMTFVTGGDHYSRPLFRGG